MSAPSQRYNDLVESYLQTVLTGKPSALVDQALRPPRRTDSLPSPAATQIFHRLLNTLTIFATIIVVLAGLVLWLPKNQLTPTQFFPSSFPFQQKTEEDIFQFRCHLQASSPEHHEPLSELLPRIAAVHPTAIAAFLQSRNHTLNAFAASSSHQVTLNSALLDLTSRVHNQLHNYKYEATHHHPDINQSPLLQSLHSIILPSSSSPPATILNNHTQLLSATITAIETTIHEAYTVKSSIADGRHDLLNGSGWFEMPGYIPRVWGKPQKKKNKVAEEKEEEEQRDDINPGTGRSHPPQTRPTQQEQELELLDGYDEATRELAVLIRDLGQGMQCLKGEINRMEALARGLEDVAASSSGVMAEDGAVVGMMDREQLETTSLTGDGDDDVDTNGKPAAADDTTATSPPHNAAPLLAAAEHSFLHVMNQAIADEGRIDRFLALYNRL